MKYLSLFIIAVIICCYECTTISDSYQMHKLDITTKNKIENLHPDQLIRITCRMKEKVDVDMIIKLKNKVELNINTVTYSVITAECTKKQILELTTFPFVEKIKSERKIDIK